MGAPMAMWWRPAHGGSSPRARIGGAQAKKGSLDPKTVPQYVTLVVVTIFALMAGYYFLAIGESQCQIAYFYRDF